VSFSAHASPWASARLKTWLRAANVITPLPSNAIILTWALYDGNINYNGALPVSGATGTYNVEISTIAIRSVSLGGRPMSSPRCPTR
jgi:hypothetical protein